MRLSKLIFVVFCLVACSSADGGGESATSGNTGGDSGQDGFTTGNDLGSTDSDGGTSDGNGSDGDTATEDTNATEDTKVNGASLIAIPASVQFGTTPMGVPKMSKFMIKNNGTEKINVVSAQITEGNDQVFTLNGPDPTGLIVPGETRNIDMKFESFQVGSKTSKLVFETMPLLDKALVVPLVGIATVATSTAVELNSTVASLKFGGVLIGTKKTAEFKLVNSGTQALQVVSAKMKESSDPDFTFTTDKSIPLILGAGSEVKVTVTYAPDKVESDSGVLEVINSSNNKPLLTVPMTGSGYTGPCSGKLVCAPNPMNFGKVPMNQPKTAVLVCSNQGFGPVVIKSFDVLLNQNDGFGWLEPGPLPITVNGGEAVALPVTFSPTNMTTKTGTINVESDDCEVPTQTIDVIAAGKQAKEPPPCLPAGEFAPKVAWEWKANDAQKKYSFVFMSPIVINLDDDDGDGDIGGGDIPEVVFVAHDGSFGQNFNDDRPGVMRAIHGKDGSPMWATSDPNHQPSWASNLAAAEIDGQPGPEIVVFGYQPSKPGKNCPGVPDILPAPFCGKYIEGHLLAFHGSDGSLYWKSQPFTGAVSDMENMGAPTLTDLEGDGIVDVVAGNTVYNGIDGTIKWVGSAGRGNDAHGYLTVVADLDGNGEREVIAGNTAYHADGSIMWTTSMTDTHGTGVADLDGNGSMEVFINGTNGESIIVDGKTGAIIKGPKYTGIIGCCVAAPAIADVDSSKPGLEIITVGDSKLKVLDKDLNLLWSKEITDETGAAGPAAFDVEGDGVAEVIYADEGTLWIMRGSDGKVIFEAPRSSATGQDNPVIADVDGDNHAEILVPMESAFGGPGLRLYSNQDDSWVATRRLWNQHSFGVADIFDNATLPQKGTAAGFGVQMLRTNHPTCK